MSVSIITRAYKTSELKNLINNLNSNNEVEKEIIAVCNVRDYNIKNAKLIIEDSNRFQARITGIKNAKYDKILLLDSDQIPEKDLLEELENKKEDMIIIPEKSVNNNFTAKCLDDWRYRNEKLARKKTTPYIPVIPRFYRKKYLLNAINKLSTDLYNIIDHEDSILYYYVFQETKNINFAKKHIYNYDPKFFKLMYKAFLYGKNRKNTKNLEIPEDISVLLYKLNKNTLNIKEIGFGKGYIMQIIRGIAYESGKIFS
ncbi:glycosyltransferase family 2 protein [Acidiplasma aeolicum]|uniref:glycosyltransferase family 2 protein n=1 Tax=Acidiplasma aeolicum TaxID=507754 RepID=UPI003713FA1A